MDDSSTCGCGSTEPAGPGSHRAAATGDAAKVGAAAWIGPLVIAASCALACAASLLTPLLWPAVALAAWFGGYRTVAVRGCVRTGDDASGSSPGAGVAAARLDRRGRLARLKTGLAFTLAAAALGAVAYCDLALLWPLAAIASWFAASFLVASATGYSGCPEVGAIPSLLLRRDIATRCPPLERTGRRNAPHPT